MLQGTASDVGKSLLTAALCRILTQDGYRTAPFKAQNMSNNSYVTPDGKEIGRAQGMQADACGIEATTDMNPILLKPTRDMSSQVVMNGVPLGNFEARVYREHVLVQAGAAVQEALARLRSRFDAVVLEGAGSPAEINLRSRDIVNMQAARWADAPVVLVADIDRGGVFASIVGTMELLEPEERERVCGFIINKFRGDVTLLQPGLDWLEKRTGKPVLGVVPWLPEHGLEEEDSLSLPASASQAPGHLQNPLSEEAQEHSAYKRVLDVIVLRLPKISNFTDMDPFRFEEDVSLRYVDHPSQWGEPDAVIVPGSKNVASDLQFLRAAGLADKLAAHIGTGGWTVGICGGYEMFAQRLLDPDGVESADIESAGLGIFPMDIVFGATKRTERVEGVFTLDGIGTALPVEGYEIHMGEVQFLGSCAHPLRLGAGAVPEGAAAVDGRCWGTFMHGIFHNDGLRRAWLNAVRESKGWEPLEEGMSFRQRRAQSFDRLADHVRAHVDIERIKLAAGLGLERML
ncbi:cobalamin biosynthesis protein CobQ [Paenibacillus beijingensis]|uniref:Cobyric acid synthase n=2 Tax=Paenibacillus beijingensis TaxID=1126833 RepID=A0A0D5NRY6_9BACL|nr:cobalamin biosynthesis protein CobQ [Paenibacillus beijingensis]